MINDNVLIKFAREKRGHTDWPEKVIKMKERIQEMKLGFPGLGNNHLSLIPFEDIQEGDMFIWDPSFEAPCRLDPAPLLFEVLGYKKWRIEGIGCGWDLSVDPARIHHRWRDILEGDALPRIYWKDPVFRVDVRPTPNGGPGYYYFYKAYRDYRY